jgi:hypothetical protein
VGALLAPTLGDYLGIGQPDIRFDVTQPAESELFRELDRFVDPKGNSIYLTSIRLRVKNMAFKQGHIDRAELVPLTIQPRPRIEVLGPDKRAITWRQVQTVEVRALMTLGPEFISPGPPKQYKLELEVRLFDNTGRQVDRYVNGLDARITLNASFLSPVVAPKKAP